MNDPKTDVLLVQRCRDNDVNAFNDLMERYKRQVFSLIYRLVQNPSDAEDLAQEVFIKVFRNLSSYDPQYAFHTWLFKITHNTTIDFLRKNKTRLVSIDENSIELEDSEPSPEEHVEIALRSELVDKVLAAVPAPYREVLMLRYQQEMPCAEIAVILGIPESTVKVRLFRARGILKQKLKGMDSR
ncbi:MAG: sigma-70 family RNA polymerase sigma factor [Verrucomicrobia bacterium]|nr:sigma-70 family RNA polymerase sigma factor [Verrucomicrobiota bacterium]MCG2681646.1 sigma-70 family RNA polymerase sigma factor [Kiritimatiellia bacterium]MBU4248098.1 sigma-70 family RNA polymerase sigma factor [Verrucomicrobiota bacterium]MBU4290774.1 sigma-70 family RNA polymerase sigma factor [Verrucomicrobiota bacterium]MBU4429751.1 sigma-70 family RNA polymerase sigma factor [Verrucomicrobiota bacterium]